MDQFTEEARAILLTLTNLLSTWGLKVIGALVLLFLGRIAAGWARRGVRNMLKRVKIDPTLVPFLASVVYYLVLATVVIAVLGLVGVQTASLIALVGAAGLAVGLALQGTLSNIAAGVMLLIFRPFKVGDYIEGGGTAGTVEAIGLFNTTLNTPDNVKISVPNSGIYGGTVKNFSANDTRRNDFVLGISYDDDIAVAIKTISEILEGDERVLREPEPVIAVSELADSSINIVVRPWCKAEDYWELRWNLMRTFKERIEAAGCSFPFPQRDVHLHGAGKAAVV